ncbi:hypothetical protein SPAR87_0201 [Streptococcus pneumoniae GA47033]|nr:hypothetical protein SPAR87_0201 [Streptococcus pneumoniae GA47033]
MESRQALAYWLKIDKFVVFPILPNLGWRRLEKAKQRQFVSG